MDTFKEKQALDDLWSKGKAPWEVWKPQRLRAGGGAAAAAAAARPSDGVESCKAHAPAEVG